MLPVDTGLADPGPLAAQECESHAGVEQAARRTGQAQKPGPVPIQVHKAGAVADAPGFGGLKAVG